MKKIGRGVMIGGGLALAVIVGAYQLGRVRAEGAPTATPLYYSGFATDSDTPIDGLHDIRVELWRDRTSTDVSMRACETIANAAPFVDGYFRVALDPTCAAATRAQPNLFVELLIDGTRIGERAAIGAVPYALEADHALRASAAAGALETRIAGVETDVVDLDTRAGMLEAPLAFRARATSAQSIPNNTAPVVVFGAVDFDNTGGEFDLATSTFTPTRAGIYDIGCNVIFNGPGTPSNIYLEAGIFVNGTRVDVAAERGDAYTQAVRIRTLLSLAAGDDVTCHAYQNSGVAMPLILPRPAEAVSTFTGMRVSD